MRRSLLGNREPVAIGVVSPVRSVPSHIRVPPYVGSSPPEMDSTSISCKRGNELTSMRTACKKAAMALAFAGSLVREHVTTDEIDAKTHDMIVGDLKCYPSPLLYNKFPKSICTSVNEVLCHGIPDSRPLQKGDIVNVDVSVYTSEGYHGDCSEMFVVGECDARAQKLIDVTRGALHAAIAACGPGVPFSVIGDVITRLQFRFFFFFFFFSKIGKQVCVRQLCVSCGG
jgi:methionyl aminopeptidase